MFRQVGGYRRLLRHAEDYDLWLRVSEFHQLRNINAVVLKYRRHAGQVSVTKFRQQAISNVAARFSMTLAWLVTLTLWKPARR